MNLIQPILIVLLLVAAVVCIRSLQMRIVTRMVVVLIATLGVVFVLRPELTNSIAHEVGLGRGADLMFYLASLAFTYCFLIVYARYRELRRDLTKLTRSVALHHAIPPGMEAENRNEASGAPDGM